MNQFTSYRKTLILVALVLILAAPLITQAQSPLQLPGDFIFQTNGYNHSFLVKVDAHTQKQSLFYSYKNGSVQPLNWSPNGQYLAILQQAPQGDWNICILSRSGQLISCMENQMARYFAIGGTETFSVYQPAWSDDDTKLFYATDVPASGGNPEYVEGDVTTGKTIRVLYNKPDMNSWADAPANGSGEFWVPASPRDNYGTYAAVDLIQFPAITASATANSSTNVTSEIRVPIQTTFAVPSHISASALQASGDDPSKHRAQFCNFSPRGQYFAAFDWGPVALSEELTPAKVDPYEFDILDSSGRVVNRMTTDSYPVAAIQQGCVIWSPDEKWFLHFGSLSIKTPGGASSSSLTIEKYLLELDGTISIKPYFTPPAAIEDYTGLQVSADEKYLLFQNNNITTVLGVDGSVLTFPGINNVSIRPLWIPPLIADVIIPASPTPVGSTAPPPSATSNGASVPGSNQIGG